MNLCKNCRFCKPDNSMLWQRYMYAKCKHPMNHIQSSVTGKISQLYCDVARGSFVSDKCGKDGKHFEVKK